MLLRILAPICFLFATADAMAVSITSKTDGTWDALATWHYTPPGYISLADGANVVEHNVELDEGHYAIRMLRIACANATAASLTIGCGGNRVSLTSTNAAGKDSHGVVVGRNVDSTGTLNILAGGVLTTTAACLGYEANSTGVVNIAGGEWKVTSGLVGIGGNSIYGSNANGTLNITDGGIFSANASMVTLGCANATVAGSRGTIILANGTFSSNQLQVGNGSERTGKIEIRNGTLSTNSTLYVGHNAGVGTLDIKNGNLTANGTLAIGYLNNGNGTLNVGPAASVTANAILYVGFVNGSGTMNVNGGLVVARSTFNIGQNSSCGTVNITAGEVKTTGSGSLNIGYENGGNGTVNLLGGALFSNCKTNIGVGANTGITTATLNLRGGIFTANGLLVISSNSGTGALNITGGAIRTGADVFLGNNTASFGTLNLTDSRGNVSLNNLNIGYVGCALVVLDNSTMTVNGSVHFGNTNASTPNASGTLNLFNNSRMEVRGGFSFGDTTTNNASRNSSMTIDSGSTLIVDGTLTLAKTNRHNAITFEVGTDGELLGITAGDLVFSGSANAPKIIVDLSKLTKKFSGPLDLALFTIIKSTGFSAPDLDAIVNFIPPAAGGIIDLGDDAPRTEWKNHGGNFRLVLTVTGLLPSRPALLTTDHHLAYALSDTYTLDADGAPSTGGDLSHLPKTTVKDGTLSITFTPARPDCYIYEVQQSRDLRTWATLKTLGPAELTGDPVTIKSDDEVTTTPSQFLRLKITPQ